MLFIYSNSGSVITAPPPNVDGDVPDNRLESINKKDI